MKDVTLIQLQAMEKDGNATAEARVLARALLELADELDSLRMRAAIDKEDLKPSSGA